MIAENYFLEWSLQVVYLWSYSVERLQLYASGGYLKLHLWIQIFVNSNIIVRVISYKFNLKLMNGYLIIKNMKMINILWIEIL